MATTPIKLKRSHTQAVIPDTSDLIAGEVALNTVDKKFYVRDDSNAVVTLSNHYGTDFDTNVVTFKVTVASSTSAHTYHGSGSSNKYKINGVFSPYLKLIPRITYRFDQSDSSNSGHPLLFYYDAAKSSSYSTGVTTNGTPGSAGAYTQIIISDSTPPVLFYQCSAHGYMGWALTTSTRNLTGFDTDDLSAGSSNLYYTDSRVQTYISGNRTYGGITSTGDISAEHGNFSEEIIVDMGHIGTYTKPAQFLVNDMNNGDHAQFTFGKRLANDELVEFGYYHVGTNSNSNICSIGFYGSSVRYAQNPLGQVTIGGTITGGGYFNEILNVNGNIWTNGSIVFEGSTADAYETTLTVADPTADRTLTLPNASGTIALTSDITSGAITVQDEGSSLSTSATTINFVGAGVTASGTGSTKTITIAGGSDGVTVQDEGSALSTTGTTLNFVGAGVTASGTGSTKTITISGGSGSSAADDITAGDAAVNITTTSGNITIDAQANNSDIIFKGTDGGSDTTFLTLDGSDAGTAIFNNNITMSDNAFIAIGASTDLRLRSNGTHGYVEHSSGSGSLILKGNTLSFRNGADSAQLARFTNGGSVELFHNDSKKIETTSTGVTVTGLLSATTKSFDIEHPTQDNMRLRYGVLEGPEHGVYVRGKLENNSVIELPEHWIGLVDEDTITVQLTPNNKYQKVYVKEIKDNKVYIGNSSLLSKINCFYFVQATRKDVDRLEVEYEN